MSEEAHDKLIGLRVFKPGDLVYLKSGSPKMTVTRGNEETVEVIWSAYGSDKIQTMVVPTVALKAANR